MESFKKFPSVIAGSAFGVGVLGLYLCHRRVFPDYMTPVSYFVSFCGFFGSTAYLLYLPYQKDQKKKRNDEAKVAKMLKDLKPAMDKYVEELNKIKKSVKDMTMAQLLEGWDEQSKIITEKLARCRSGLEAAAISTNSIVACSELDGWIEGVDLTSNLDPVIAEFLTNQGVKLVLSDRGRRASMPVPSVPVLQVGNDDIGRLLVNQRLARAQYEIEVNEMFRENRENRRGSSDESTGCEESSLAL